MEDYIREGRKVIAALIVPDETGRATVNCAGRRVPAASARSVWELICLNAAPFGYDLEVAA